MSMVDDMEQQVENSVLDTLSTAVEIADSKIHKMPWHVDANFKAEIDKLIMQLEEMKSH